MSAFGKHSICQAAARVLALAAFALVSSPGIPVFAASLIAPRNYGELARAADAVVFARARASVPAARGPLVFTTTEFEVLSSYSGPTVPGDVIKVELSRDSRLHHFRVFPRPHTQIACRNKHFRVVRIKKISSNLLTNELVVRFIAVKRANDVVSIAPGIRAFPIV